MDAIRKRKRSEKEIPAKAEKITDSKKNDKTSMFAPIANVETG